MTPQLRVLLAVFAAVLAVIAILVGTLGGSKRQ